MLPMLPLAVSSFHCFAEYWLCKYRETTIHAKQWKIPKVSAVALRGSSRMYPSVSIFFDRPCPIVFSQIVANLNIYHSIRNILWQILNWYDLISIIFNVPFKSPKMVPFQSPHLCWSLALHAGSPAVGAGHAAGSAKWSRSQAGEASPNEPRFQVVFGLGLGAWSYRLSWLYIIIIYIYRR